MDSHERAILTKNTPFFDVSATSNSSFPEMAWQADNLGLLYSENSRELCVVVHAKTICFSRHNMVYLEGVILNYLVHSAGTVQQKCSYHQDCTMVRRAPRGFRARSKGSHLLEVKEGTASRHEYEDFHRRPYYRYMHLQYVEPAVHHPVFSDFSLFSASYSTHSQRLLVPGTCE